MIRPAQLRSFVRRQLARLEQSLESALSGGQVEGIHQVRVGSRRLNEPLKLMSAWLPAGDVKQARRRLSRLRRCFQEVRDLDVLQKRLCEAGPLGVLDANTLARLEGVFTARREKALGRAVKCCRGGRTVARVRRLVGTTRVSGQTTSPRLPRITLDDGLHRLIRTRAEKLHAVDPRHNPTLDLHAVRLHLKRFRYSVELAAGLGVGVPDATLVELKAMQDLLGKWNDELFAARLIARLAARETTLAAEPAWSAALLTYAGRWASMAAEDKQRIRAGWGDLHRTMIEGLPVRTEQAAPPEQDSPETQGHPGPPAHE